MWSKEVFEQIDLLDNMPNLSSFPNKSALRKWYREYRAKNREKFREYNREYNKRWRDTFGYTSEDRYKKKYPIKRKASQKICGLIQAGKLKRGDCNICSKPNAQAHHPDHRYWNEIIWLCPLHHSMTERGILVFDKSDIVVVQKVMHR